MNIYKIARLALILFFVVSAKGQAQEDDTNQQVYTIPFASQGNQLEISVVNSSSSSDGNTLVNIENVPEWIDLTPNLVNLGELEEGEEATARFTFHIEEDAPVGQTVTLKITALNSQRLRQEKNITLKVAPPSKFSLDQNYPNPFNPSTTIKYRLPAEMNVTVKVYNMLGQEVAILADGLQAPGTQTLQWDASHMASGLYFYRVVAEDLNGRHMVQNKKMMLIK